MLAALLILSAPVPVEASALVKADILKRIAALSTEMAGMTADRVDKAADDIAKLAGPFAVQRVLGGRYPDAKGPERLAILYVLNRVGVEGALPAMPAIAADFAASRPKHPNDLSFATFYVVERFMRLAWKRLPAPGHDIEEPKASDRRKDDPAPEKLVSRDGTTSTGTLADRKELLRLVVAGKLNARDRGKPPWPLPSADEQHWVRTVGGFAFVRIRGKSSGTDLLFRQDGRGQWTFVIALGQWVN